jgi:hypothetical protein
VAFSCFVLLLGFSCDSSCVIHYFLCLMFNLLCFTSLHVTFCCFVCFVEGKFWGVNKKQRSCDGRGGAQRPVLYVNESKKDGCAQRPGAHARPKPTSISIVPQRVFIFTLFRTISFLQQIPTLTDFHLSDRENGWGSNILPDPTFTYFILHILYCTYCTGFM